MSIATYGVEAIWEGQSWVLKGFDKVTIAIARAVVGTFSTTQETDAIQVGDAMPTRAALDRR
jgi:hypothetical protein